MTRVRRPNSNYHAYSLHLSRDTLLLLTTMSSSSDAGNVVSQRNLAAPLIPSTANKRSDACDEESPPGQQPKNMDTTTATNSTSTPTAIIPLSELDPPPSRSELLRDKWLDFLSGKVHFCIGITVMFLIVVDGAFFFFLLIGAQNMCSHPSRTDCNPRNWWYNFSIQFLNVLFTYLATISLPWRLSNAVHLFMVRGWDGGTIDRVMPV